MRDQGRCAGCHRTGPRKQLDWHVTACEQWARLWREDPAAALLPGPEYARWRAEERPAEHAAGLRGRVADTVARREQSVGRFQARDPLEE